MIKIMRSYGSVYPLYTNLHSCSYFHRAKCIKKQKTKKLKIEKTTNNYLCNIIHLNLTTRSELTLQKAGK